MEKAASDQSPLPYAISDLKERMKMAIQDETEEGDTFAQRAESYYLRRPHLLSLLHDLFHVCITLHNKPSRTKLSNSHNYHLQRDDKVEQKTEGKDDSESEIESALSFKQTQEISLAAEADQNLAKTVDDVVLQLVSKGMENNMLLDELCEKKQQCHEACKIIELLKKIVELLELEKELTVKENAKLGHKVRYLFKENRELVEEAMFMKREAIGLARCVLSMRVDHFQEVCFLQEKIYRLQTGRNHQAADKSHPKMVLLHCFRLEKCMMKNKTKKVNEARSNDDDKNKGSKWWKRLKNIHLFRSSLFPTSASPFCI